MGFPVAQALVLGTGPQRDTPPHPPRPRRAPAGEAFPGVQGKRGVLPPFLKVKEIDSSFPGVKLRFHVSVLMEKANISLRREREE